MITRALFAAAVLTTGLAGCTPTKNYHGYIADEAAPSDIEPGVDTRSTVLARLGSPSTKSIFDDDTWIYMSSTRERFAFYLPKTSERTVTAIRFGNDDTVQDQNDENGCTDSTDYVLRPPRYPVGERCIEQRDKTEQKESRFKAGVDGCN